MLVAACKERSDLQSAADKVTALKHAIEGELRMNQDSERSFQEVVTEYRKELKPLLRKPDWSSRCNSECSESLFRAVGSACFFSDEQISDPELPDILRSAYASRSAIGAATERDALKVRECFLRFRRFDDAREFSREIGIAKTPPSLVMPRQLPVGRRIMRYAIDGQTLRVDNLPGRGPREIIMLASPTCEASMKALADLESDRLIRKRTLPVLTVVTPPTEAIEPNAFLAWNKKHPQTQMVQAFGGQDWPEVDDWSFTPTFIFMSNGKVVKRIPGWAPMVLEEMKSFSPYNPGNARIAP